MNHVKPATRIRFRPATASSLELQQKMVIFGAFASALETLGSALRTFLSLGQD